jgi:hypothetical protein
MIHLNPEPLNKTPTAPPGACDRLPGPNRLPKRPSTVAHHSLPPISPPGVGALCSHDTAIAQQFALRIRDLHQPDVTDRTIILCRQGSCVEATEAGCRAAAPQAGPTCICGTRGQPASAGAFVTAQCSSHSRAFAYASLVAVPGLLAAARWRLGAADASPPAAETKQKQSGDGSRRLHGAGSDRHREVKRTDSSYSATSQFVCTTPDLRSRDSYSRPRAARARPESSQRPFLEASISAARHRPHCRNTLQARVAVLAWPPRAWAHAPPGAIALFCRLKGVSLSPLAWGAPVPRAVEAPGLAAACQPAASAAPVCTPAEWAVQETTANTLNCDSHLDHARHRDLRSCLACAAPRPVAAPAAPAARRACCVATAACCRRRRRRRCCCCCCSCCCSCPPPARGCSVPRPGKTPWLTATWMT